MNKLKTIKYKTSSGIPSSNGSHTDNSLFDKISKRYSTVRFLRKTTGRKTSTGKQQPISGSYDMSGRDSDDHKLEIGAPVLISKTSIDTDTIDSRKVSLNKLNTSDQSDIYMDANSSSGGGANHSTSFGELKFSFYTPDTSVKETNGDVDNENVYDLPRASLNKLHADDSKNFNGVRSKSAVNLHRTELSMNLERTPSLSSVAQQPKHPLSISRTSIDKSATNLPSVNEYCIPAVGNQRTSSKQSLNQHGLNSRGYSYSHDSIAANSSIFDETDPEEDFDLRSASFQSLEARNLFLSIEELNDITKQINEADEFKPTGEQDLEYCTHRDNLKPSERRITLLRNKNQRLIKVGHKKDKISNAWSDFKTWIGEEKGKIREVVHKHAALQRVGANFQKPPMGSNASLDCNDGPNSNDNCANGESNARNVSNDSDESPIVNKSSVNSTKNTNNVPMKSSNNNSEQTHADGNESSATSTLNGFGSRKVVGAEDNEVNEQLTRSIDSRVKHDVSEVTDLC